MLCLLEGERAGRAKFLRRGRVDFYEAEVALFYARPSSVKNSLHLLVATGRDLL